MVKKELSGITERFLRTIADDVCERYGAFGGLFELRIVNATRLVNELKQNHDLDQRETAVLGAACVAAELCASLMSPHSKSTFTLYFRHKKIRVEADSRGNVRGFVETVDETEKSHRRQSDRVEFVVSSTLFDFPERFNQALYLEDGSVDGIFTLYLRETLGYTATLRTDLYFDRAGHLRAAVGFIARTLSRTHEDFAEVEETLLALDSPGFALANALTPSEIVKRAFKDYDPYIENSRPVQFDCACDEHDLHMHPLPEGLSLTGVSMEKHLPWRCDYCGSRYAAKTAGTV